MASDLIKNLDDGTFKDFLATTETPVLVDFWAEWCGPCKMIAPVVEEIANEYQGKIQVAKVNVDQNRGVPAEYKINSIPTLVMFKGGSEVDRFVGFRTKKELKTILDKHT
ncbi:MAG: thioredoxin [Peptococcaceae bacterium BICA1-7]|nr:MAG: thioredoxin [Peptococcaceae bacterium BICA1-7]HBV95742.1 thioredoxin [Desulfotomaculum sp.]